MNISEYEKYDYISFDIFDTLIKRNINKPTDIFKVIEERYNENNKNKIFNFVENRIMAENECRKRTTSEVNLDEIYELISSKYSKKIALELKKLEISIELDFCQKNNNTLVIDLYQWAKKNKKVIIISDMYLPLDVIKQILKKNNIEYEKLYLSSDVGVKKTTGELFKYVLKDLNIKPYKILHVGDNIHSDIKMSKKNKIKSLLIKNNFVNTSIFIKRNIEKNEKSLNYNIQTSFIKNNVPKNQDYFYNFGYITFGPLLYSFSIWLKRRLNENKINKVFFLARDGKIIKKAFDIINNKSDLYSEYMMASRRAIIVPSLWKCKNIDEIFEKINIPSKISIDDLSRRIGLDKINIDYLLSKYSIEKKVKKDFKQLKVEYKDFFDELYPLIINNSKMEYDALNSYLSSIKFNNKVAIVDIGWFGNMQNALEKIVDDKTDIYGFYIGLRPNKRQNIKTYGYLFDENKNIELNNFEMSTNAIFEFIFSATHGSVMRFVNTKEKYELYDSENKSQYENDALNSLQKGAIDFVKDLSSSDVSKYYKENVSDSVYNLVNFLKYPNINDSKKLGNLKFKDSEIIYIAKTDKLYKYIVSPKKFIKDLKNSTWKIGFLKRCFKVDLPYYKIFCILKRISEKNERIN